MRYGADGSDCPLLVNICETKWPCSGEGDSTYWKEWVTFLFWLKNVVRLALYKRLSFQVMEGLTKSIDLICRSQHLLLQNVRPISQTGLVCLKRAAAPNVVWLSTKVNYTFSSIWATVTKNNCVLSC